MFCLKSMQLLDKRFSKLGYIVHLIECAKRPNMRKVVDNIGNNTSTFRYSDVYNVI